MPDRFKAFIKIFASGFVNSVAGRLLGENFVIIGKVYITVV